MAAITKITLVGATGWRTGDSTGKLEVTVLLATLADFSWLVSEVIPRKTGVSIWIKVVPLRPVPLVLAPLVISELSQQAE